MFLLLLAAGTLYLAFSEWQEGLILFGFVLVAEQRSQKSGEKLSKATLHATLANVKNFFH